MMESALQRLRWLGVISALTGALALVAMIAELPVFVLVSAITLAALSGAALAWHTGQLQQRLDQTHGALGRFIRGTFDERIAGIQGLDALGRLQHRINNLLDIVDLALRKEHAAIDSGADEAYLGKISGCALYHTLHNQMERMPVLEIPAQLNVGPLMAELEQLQQAVAQTQATSQALLGRVARTEHVAEDYPHRTALHVRKAVNQARHASVTVKNLHTALEKIIEATAILDRLAERGEILALNMAISAAHTGGGERINAAVSSVRLLADQTRHAKDAITASTTEMRAATQEAMRTLYDIAKLVHQINESFFTLTESAQDSAQQQDTLLREVKQAIVVADDLHARATRFDDQIKQLQDAA